LEQADIAVLKMRTATGALVPLGTLVSLVATAGPALVQRYNRQVSVPVQGSAVPGVSTREALFAIQAPEDGLMAPGMEYELTELSFQERDQGNTAIYIFALSLLVTFQFLAALL
jgi:HAE1 family hydrophobic/amphiphilic exporter-1